MANNLSKRENLYRYLRRFKSVYETRKHLKKILSRKRLLSKEYVDLIEYDLRMCNRCLAGDVLKKGGQEFYDTEREERYLSEAEELEDDNFLVAEVRTVISRPTLSGNMGGDIRDYYLIDLASRRYARLEHFDEVSPEAEYGRFTLTNPSLRGKNLSYTIKDIAYKNPLEPRTVEKSLESLLGR